MSRSPCPILRRHGHSTRPCSGAEVTEPQALPEHGVTVVFIKLPNTKIELLEPLGEGSPIAAFLEKEPVGRHASCLL
jgi:methylmalonyl-CoA/ethylmalonyl-CoA epimerase